MATTAPDPTSRMVAEALRYAAVAMAFAAVGWSLGPFRSIPASSLAGFALLVVLFSGALHKRGYVAAATTLVSGVVWVCSAIGVSYFWGIDEHTAVMMVPSILIGGLLIGPRGAIACTLMTLGWVLTEWLWGPAPQAHVRRPFRAERAQDLFLAFSVIGLLVWQLVRHYRRFLDDAVRNEHEARDSAAELKQAEAMQRALLQQAPAAMLVLGDDGQVELASDAAHELLGADPVGRAVHMVLEEAGASEETTLTQPFGGAPVALERRRLVEGGAGREIVVLTDLRALKAHEEQQRQALQAAEGASRAKSVFLANMSHELRTPLNAIIGYSEMLEEELDDEAQRGDVDRILRSGRHLLSLIDDVLDMSRVEAGRTRLDLEEVNLRELIDEIRAAFVPTASSSDIQLTLTTTTSTLHTDRLRLRQILFNLLSNALKFASQRVMLVIDGTGDDVHFDVVDDGPGIEPSLRRQLFQPFARGAQSEGGTGLGLALSREFAHRLGGRLTLQSSDKGAHFQLRLPRHTELVPDEDGDQRFYGARRASLSLGDSFD